MLTLASLHGAMNDLNELLIQRRLYNSIPSVENHKKITDNLNLHFLQTRIFVHVLSRKKAEKLRGLAENIITFSTMHTIATP